MPEAAAPNVRVVRTAPRTADAIGVAVGPAGVVPRQVGLNRAALEANGFTGSVGQTLVIPAKSGSVVVAVGVGDDPSAKQLRDAAAAFARAAGKRGDLAVNLVEGVRGAAAIERAAQAVVEGVLLARYHYVGLKTDTSSASPVESLSLVVDDKSERATTRGADRGVITAGAALLARDLENTPPSHLTARDLAVKATEIAAASGLAIEVYDKDQLRVLGCGGILGVNAGSTEPPRMIKLTYTPRRPKAHVALVGKGVMYDSGGISLKPSNPMHAMMKMDMSGAAAVLAAMSALDAVGCRNRVSAWLMCTDNMPSGSAMKLGDVLRIRNGKTVEIHNTDAEGRLVLADGLSLAAEEEPDAIIDIATLTGAALAALGQDYAALFSSDDALADAILASSVTTDEPLWRMPLARDQYRSNLDSSVADMKNIGGPYAGAITAAIFLSEFAGEGAWAHLDIAGTMSSESDSGWKSKGATGFGARTLLDLACTFTPPEPGPTGRP